MNKKSREVRKFLDYRQFLVDELQRRQKKNPAYSLRAFSRDLGIGSSRVSEIIHAKVGLSEERAVEIAQRLQLAEAEKALFIDLVQSEHARSNIAREAAKTRLKARFTSARNVTASDFHLISDWHNLALMELLNLDDLEHNTEIFAQKLGLRAEVVIETIERLIQLGYIRQHEGRWQAIESGMTAASEVPSSAIRSYHSQILDKAKKALHEKPMEERDFSSIVFALNSSQMDYVKNRIKEFRRTLVTELEEAPGKDGVFCLSLQFFEMTEKK